MQVHLTLALVGVPDRPSKKKEPPPDARNLQGTWTPGQALSPAGPPARVTG